MLPSFGEPIVHVISDAGPNGYFRALLGSGEIAPESVVVGSVSPAGPLQAEMRALSIRSFALGATRRSQFPLAVARLARVLRTLRASIVQTHLLDGSIVGGLGARLACVPLSVFTAHHSHELPFHGAKLVWSDRVCAGLLADYVIAPSKQVAETLVSHARVDPSKIEVIHHGFDMKHLDPTRTDPSTARTELGLHGKVVFGAVGRLFSLKNYETLLAAFGQIATARPNLVLVIVGAGDHRQLEQLSRTLGLGDRVIFAGQRSDIPSLMSSFDVFVHPALAESFGMVIVEAMAMARPVLSTPVGIAPEIISSGSNGVLSKTCDVAGIAAGLHQMLRLEPSWRRMGDSARLAASKFTASSMSLHHLEAYTRWLADTLPPANSRNA
jgi:glycosyltransferase involved in cell wall biosynthesis